jgi:GT2 family glycosyltransferase
MPASTIRHSLPSRIHFEPYRGNGGDSAGSAIFIGRRVGATLTNEIEVSIIICTRNRADRLSGTLAALRALRTCHTYEVVWIDNASTDNTADVLRNALAADRVGRYVFGERIGLGAARNLGWETSRGKIVAFTDDDCYPSPDYVDALIAAFSEHPDAGVIGGRVLLHDQRHAKITIDEGQTARVFLRHSFVRAGSLQGANFAFRREALEAIGGIDPELGAGTRFPCEDIDAVAAVLWAGFDARFDPRPTVRHDHGRFESDVPALLESYDRGRGGYYAKYILRSDTCAKFIIGWLKSAWHKQDWQGVRSLRTEMIAAAQYAIVQKRYKTLLMAAPMGVVVLTFQVLVSFFFRLGRRLRALASV